VYDYVDGKVDWMAFGLPVEGKDGPFVGGLLSEVATCDVAGTAGDARRLLDRPGTESVVVVAGGGLVVGEVEAGTLEGHADGERLLDVMDPVPTTVRPSVTVASLAEGGGGRRLVTTSDGRLLGEVTVAVDEDRHAGHDHAATDGDMEAFERELTQVMAAVEERFGDREPSEVELRSFLRDRLVAEGRSPEDADRFLDELDAGEAD
jgi:CBS domain-containing protein